MHNHTHDRNNRYVDIRKVKNKINLNELHAICLPNKLIYVSNHHMHLIIISIMILKHQQFGKNPRTHTLPPYKKCYYKH